MVAAIILAAGRSERMGEPKQLLQLEGKSFLQRLYDTLRQSQVERIRVVLGHRAREIAARVDIDAADIVVNKFPDRGMLSSLQAGLQSLLEKAAEGGTPAAVLLCPVDHPNISAPLVDGLIGAWREKGRPIVIPVHDGRRGHPVLFDSSVFEELLAAPLDVGARHVVRADPDRVLEVPVDDQGILQDIDTPEDYRGLTGGGSRK